MARIYATFDAGAIGPGLELEQGGLVVVSNTAGLDIHRLARGNIATGTSGRYFYEAAFYGDGALADRCSVGIVQATHSLSEYAGEGALSYGLRAGDDGVYSNSVQVVGVDAVDKRTWIGVLVDMDALTCSWFVDGSLVASTSIAAAPWYPAVTVAADEAYDLRCYVNFGQYAFERPQTGTDDRSGNYLQGWFSTTPEPAQLRFCPRGARAFHTGPADSLPLASFAPRILNADGFSYARRATVWTQGRAGSSASFGTIELDNEDGVYDALASEDRRDQLVEIRVAPAESAYNDSTVVATAAVDRIEANGEKTLRVTLKDPMALLRRGLQRRRYPPWADAGVANTPLPISLGAVRNVQAPLEIAVDREYRLHDAAITNIVAVRDMGALLDPNASPPQYTPTSTAEGIALETDAVGLLTVDMSSEGRQVVIPGIADVLAGAGELTAWPNPSAAPTGWAWGAGSGNTLTRQSVAQAMPQDYVAALSTGDAFNPDIGEDGAWLRYDTAVLEPGRTYRIQFRLVRTAGPGSSVIGGISYGLLVRSDLTNSPTGAVSPHMQPLQAPQFGVSGESYTFTHTVPAGAARKLWFIASAARDITGSGIGLASVVFYGVRVQLLGEISATLPLVGINLARYYAEIFARAGVADSEWVVADCEAIDAATGYSFGVYLDRETMVDDALRVPLDSYCATLFADQLARYRVRRIIDPSTVGDGDVVAWFTEDDIAEGISVRPDLAPGLTLQMGARTNWRRFSESDFVTDTLAVPPAVRTQFMRESQLVETAPITPSPTYRAAAQAPPIRSLFDDARMARREIARVASAYAAGRVRGQDGRVITTLPRFIDLTVYYSGDAPPNLLFADVIHVTHARFGLAAGQKLAVFDVSPSPYRGAITITAWGSE